MAFSLSKLFKGKGAAEPGAEAATNGSPTTVTVAPAAPAAPPSAVRTVTPKSAQPVSLRDPGARQPVSLTSAVPPPVTTNRISPVRPPARKITFPVPSGPRPVAVAAPAPTPMVAAPVPAPEAPDANVTLTIGDFLDRLPANFLTPGPHDRRQSVEFKASELYSDLTKGRASVPASTIYAKVPSIFARPVTDTEDIEVALPLQKLVEQLSSAFTRRADQVAEENVGEIETPFLQVAKEDNERLPTAAGTVSGAIRPAMPAPSTPEETTVDFPVRPSHRTGQISTISAPKVPLDPPPMPTVAASAVATGPINPGKRPPSTVRASVAGGKIRLSGPSAVTRMTPVQVPPAPTTTGAPSGVSTASQRIQLPMQGAPGPAASPSLAVSKKTARIQIPPISLRAGGQGGVTGRAGSTPAPVPVQASPVSIRPPMGTDLPVTFRSSPPPPPSAKPPPASFAATVRPNFPPPPFPAVPPAASEAISAPAQPVAPTPVTDDRRIELGLAAVLRGIPSEALAVEPWTIADDVRVSLPFGPVEKQLSLGRVSIPMDTFVQALPESHRDVFAPESGLSEVQLPLPEIFQNLPASALAIRPDQVVEETGTYYPTPFSQKADEDAQRFGAPSTPVLPEDSVSPSEAVPTTEPASEEPASPAFTDQAEAAVEVFTPVVEPEQPAEPVRDIPLDLEESAPATAEQEPGETPAPEPEIEKATTVSETPGEAAVEPPVSTEPTPVEEALAVLESTAPVPPPEASPVTQPASEPGSEAAEPANTALPAAKIKGHDSALQTLFMTEEDIDAKVVVRLVCQLPGVSGCAVMFADGLRLAGNFPDGDAEGFSAMTPPFFKRTQNFVSELKLGGLKAFTLFTETELLSFFMHDDICVSVRHSGRGFLPGVREKLEIVTRELAGMYSTAKPVPADSGL